MWVAIWTAARRLLKAAVNNVWIMGAIGACVVIALAYGIGFSKARGAARLDAERARAQAAEQRLKKSEDDLAYARRQIEDLHRETESVRAETRTIVAAFPALVKDNRACDAGVDVLRLLDQAGGVLPVPPGRGAHGAAATAPVP